jgi:hypothetical protein
MTQEPDPTPVDSTSVPEAIRDLPTSPEPTAAFGWNAYAERINGRFAMVGFIALLLLEFFSRQDFFTWLGLR